MYSQAVIIANLEPVRNRTVYRPKKLILNFKYF